jgi:hypothetical protein
MTCSTNSTKFVGTRVVSNMALLWKQRASKACVDYTDPHVWLLQLNRVLWRIELF